jgi:hypothetical protein
VSQVRSISCRQTADAILVNVHRIDQTRDNRIPCRLKKRRQIRPNGKKALYDHVLPGTIGVIGARTPVILC